MVLQRSMPATHPMLVIALVVLAVLLAMAALTVIFGVHGTGPSYEILPDPARLLGLPF